MKIINKLFYITLFLLVILSCGKEGCTDPLAHNFDDSAKKDDGKCFYGIKDSLAAQFSFEFLDSNIVSLKVVSPRNDLDYFWDLDNGKTSNDSTVIGIYPFKGIKEVSLLVSNSQGFTSSSQQFNITKDSIELLENPLLFFISGGANPKTWCVDSNSAGHIGVGPLSSTSPVWYSAQPNEKPGVGLYDDRYTFTLNNFLFDMNTNGLIYIHNTFQSQFPNSYQNLFDYSSPFVDPPTGKWNIDEDSVLTFSQGLHLGFYTGASEYKITKLNDDTLWVEYLQSNDQAAKWYGKFIAVQ